MPLTIVIVCPTLLCNDAVGSATISMLEVVKSRKNTTVKIIAKNSDIKNDDIAIVRSLSDLLINEYFLSADIIIYVFAIYSDLFQSIIIGNGHAKQIVRFHNVTPAALMPATHATIIEKSVGQISLFSKADCIWADSQENAEELRRRGIDLGLVKIVPFPISLSNSYKLQKKNHQRTRFLYVGRFSQSKNIEDLVKAAAILRKNGGESFEIFLLGSTRHSDPAYINLITKLIKFHSLSAHVKFVGDVNNDELSSFYGSSHAFITASRHEGFCVPVIEALHAGCVPITYSNSNLKYISDGLGVLCECDDPENLALMMGRFMTETASHSADGSDSLISLSRGSTTLDDFRALARSYVSNFEIEAVSQRIHYELDRLLS